MLCQDCKNKPVVRGLKSIKCFNCNENRMVNYAYSANICTECSQRLCVCECCGKLILPEKFVSFTTNELKILRYWAFSFGEVGTTLTQQKLSDKLFKELVVEIKNRDKE